MRVHLKNTAGVTLLEQEVIFTGRLPDAIRWDGRTFCHKFTSWPGGLTIYEQVVVLDMPPPLPPGVSCNSSDE